MASIFEQAAGYLPWNSWGGTEHLEDKRAAAVKYSERITGWSDTDMWGRWIDSDRLIALDDAQKAYFYAKDAAGYWARVASLWEGYAETMISIHPDQYDRIGAAVGASEDAAKTYRNARNWVGYAKEIIPTPAQFPWWLWLGGAVLAWRLILK